MSRDVLPASAPPAYPAGADLTQLLEVCLERINNAIVIAEAETINARGPRIVWANRVFYDRNGYSPEEVLGQSPRLLQGSQTDRATLDRIRTALQAWQALLAETLNYRKDGTSEDQVRRLAFYDALTDLPNRRMLGDRLNKALATSQRSGRHGALMFIDLDNFKPLNDTYGHDAGGLLLREVARRLRQRLRGVGTVARFGGDEFVVILSGRNAAMCQAKGAGRNVVRFHFNK